MRSDDESVADVNDSDRVEEGSEAVDGDDETTNDNADEAAGGDRDDPIENEGDGKYPLISAVPDLYKIFHRSEGNKREIGLLEQGAVWTLSSAKPGNGVDALRDGNFDTYWQSDATQPHTVSVQFQKRATISHVCIYLDFNLDESYTPREIAVKVGMTFHDVEEFTVISVHEPVGWIIIPCESNNQPFVRAHLIQVCITAMHQNGRDTHVRLVKFFGPRHNRFEVESMLPSTVEMSQFDTIR